MELFENEGVNFVFAWGSWAETPIPLISYARLLYLLTSSCCFSTEVDENLDDWLPACFVAKY